MDTKEKIEIERKFVILEQYHVPQLNGKLQTTSDRVAVYAAFDAMDEFAKLQSIAFAKWILQESILPRDTNWFDAGKHLTSEELYENFLISDTQELNPDDLPNDLFKGFGK